MPQEDRPHLVLEMDREHVEGKVRIRMRHRDRDRGPAEGIREIVRKPIPSARLDGGGVDALDEREGALVQTHLDRFLSEAMLTQNGT